MSRITVWVTDHPISQRVGAALKTGLQNDALLAFAPQASAIQIAQTPVHIGYGILRGMDKVSALAEEAGKPWFIADLGYLEPGHYTGNYRIGFRGTQNLFDEKIQSNDNSTLAAWRDGGEAALLCPPTDYVTQYFGLKEEEWIEQATALAQSMGLPAKLRRKGDPEELDQALDKAACVITFNSSVGWRALARGIPAFSDPARSTVGSWHGPVKSLAAVKNLSREALFRFMRASQMSLLEIQQGKIYDILGRYTPEITPLSLAK